MTIHSSPYKIKVSDPSGETRFFNLKPSQTVGRAPAADVLLRDPTAPPLAFSLTLDLGVPNRFWIKSLDDKGIASLSGVLIKETSLPPHLSLKIGETTLTIVENKSIHSLPASPLGAKPWLTKTPSGASTLWMTKKAAETPLSIYLAGETGTGKEVLAHLIHAWSNRAAGPFIPLHCGALPLSLAESELFGHVKGAFTGAHHQRTGALMQAHNGTLFLDEVGDLSLELQVKLLRFLENGEIRPVGSDRTSRADVRILCATHLPLEKLVEEGRFRRDLFYRLASVTIQIPTLRARPDDIEMLANEFARPLGKEISPSAMLRLQAHSWPGNVRELRHAIERACGLAGHFVTLLQEEHLEFMMKPAHSLRSPELELHAPVLKLSEMERVLILRALRISHGNRTIAAKILGIARSTLFEMLKRHRIQGPKTNPFEEEDAA